MAMSQAGDRNGSDAHGYELAAWKAPLIIAAILLLMVAGAYLGGPGLAMAMGSLAASGQIVMAVRQAPRLPIVPPEARDGRTHLLLVANEPLESPETIDRVVAAAGAGEGDPDEADVLVIAPNRPRFVERWASDTDRGERQAQRCLVLTLAVLAKAGIPATARVGDEDLVQAVDDQLRSYPATKVVLVDHPHPGTSEATAARQLRSRLQVPFLHLIDAPPVSAAATRH
jgi:hypothetical protein